MTAITFSITNENKQKWAKTYLEYNAGELKNETGNICSQSKFLITILDFWLKEHKEEVSNENN